MSLISPKNFTAPLSNVVSLATIIVVGLLILVYRWAGGELVFRNLEKAPEASYIGDRVSETYAEVEPVEKNKPAKVETSKRSAEELLDGLLVEEEEKVERNWGKEKSPLDDIAKQLGAE